MSEYPDNDDLTTAFLTGWPKAAEPVKKLRRLLDGVQPSKYTLKRAEAFDDAKKCRRNGELDGIVYCVSCVLAALDGSVAELEQLAIYTKNLAGDDDD